MGTKTQRRIYHLDQGTIIFIKSIQRFIYLSIWFIVYFLFQYVQNNKEADNDWFRLESNKEGTRWFGKCWYIHNLLKYEFDVEFDVSICD